MKKARVMRALQFSISMLSVVMRGHSRPKAGVGSFAYARASISKKHGSPGLRPPKVSQKRKNFGSFSPQPGQAGHDHVYQLIYCISRSAPFSSTRR